MGILFFFLDPNHHTVRCPGGQRHHGQKEVGHGGGDVFLGNHFLFFLGKSGMVESSGELMVPKRFKFCGDVQYILYMYTGYIYMYIRICIDILMNIFNDMPSRGFFKMSRLEAFVFTLGPRCCEAARKEILFGSYFFHVASVAFFWERRIYGSVLPF